MMRGNMQNIEGFEWRGDMACFVDVDGKPVSRQKEQELYQRSKELSDHQMMERLEIARAAFDCMESDIERRAAFEWVRQIYKLGNP